jgi:uncharacterized protein with PIN domain
MPKLMADHMVGKTCKWMRIMGYDTSYPQCRNDTDILKKCIAENRILLTRDYEFYKRYSRSIFLDSPYFRLQIKQVAKLFPPEKGLFFSRCPLCNGLLEEVSSGSMGQEFESVKSRFSTVKYCPNCNKYYWNGSHYEKILLEIDSILKG